MHEPVNRRHLLIRGLAAALASGLPSPCALAAADGAPLPATEPFSFDGLQDRARALAAAPWQAPVVRDRDILEQIDYDRVQQIRYRPEATLALDAANRTPVQLFQRRQLFQAPVAVHVVEDGRVRPIPYRPDLFDMPADHPAHALSADGGFAGFRVMNRTRETDWLAFLGASYFRASGPHDQYGLSARGLAVGIALPTPEEFPRFTAFWLEAGRTGREPIIVHALLDGPSVTGAYRFDVDRTTGAGDLYRVTMDVEAHLYPRVDIARVGIAPFSSMFWYGEAGRRRAADWRPEIHDSDGLAIETGRGERIWRPLNNPRRVITSVFADHDPKGFGLLQRDREFVHYLDDGVFYERRPSAWVEPHDGWGPGAVHLLEIPTDTETQDNIAAYWCPDGGLTRGRPTRWRYRLSWVDDIPFPETLARATATWTGLGGRPGLQRPQGVRKYVIDWQGRSLAGLSRDDGVEVVVTPGRGAISNAYAHPVVDQRERWRSFFDIEATGPEPVDIRVYLRRTGRPLTETWIGQHLPDD